MIILVSKVNEMSKLKLRIGRIFQDGKVQGSKNWVHYNSWSESRNEVKLITNFSSDENSIYTESITRYNSYPFRIHRLWIETIDSNTSCLMVHHNPFTIKDLAPFWGICDTERFLQGKTNIKHYDFNSVEEAYSYNYKNYEYAEWPTSKEKYKIYRKKQSEKKAIDWAIKKDEKAYSKLSKKRKRELSKKTKYTWND